MNEKLESMIKEVMLRSGVEYVAPTGVDREFCLDMEAPIIKFTIENNHFVSMEDQAAIDEIAEFMEKYRG
jgi:hypothetical protein